MKTLTLTAEHFNADNEYIGTENLDGFDGSVVIEIAGYAKFKRLIVTGDIIAKAGCGIKAGEGIEAGRGIKAGEGIEVKLRIFAGLVMHRLPTDDELKVTCAKLLSGTIACGSLVETKGK